MLKVTSLRASGTFEFTTSTDWVFTHGELFKTDSGSELDQSDAALLLDWPETPNVT
jgi:hypothetical protein